MGNIPLKEMHRQGLLGTIIEKSVELEFWIDQKIMHFFNPENRDVFRKVVLNPGVISFYAKTKILQNIGVDKKTVENARQVNNIRNAFAHNKIFNFDHENLYQEKVIWNKPESIIYTMKSNGELETKPVLDYVQSYLKKIEEVIDELHPNSDNT